MTKRTFRFLVLCAAGVALFFLPNSPFSGWMRGEAPLQRGTPPAAGARDIRRDEEDRSRFSVHLRAKSGIPMQGSVRLRSMWRE